MTGGRGSKLKRIGFALVATVVLLGGIEGAVRLLLPPLDWKTFTAGLVRQSYRRWDGYRVLNYTFDPRYNFRLLPRKWYSRDKTLVSINELGLLGPLPMKTKKPGVFRILVLGGSSTFQVSFVNGKAWPELMAERLAAAGRSVEVINASTPGYTAYQSGLRLSAELLDYSPDLVLVDHVWNDLKLFGLDRPEAEVERWNEMAAGQTEINALSSPRILDALDFSQAVVQLRTWLLQRKMAGVKGMSEGRESGTLDGTIKPGGVEFYRRNLDRIAETLASRGIPAVIIKEPLLVRPDNTPAEKAQIRYAYVGFDHATLVEAINAAYTVDDDICARHRITCVDPGASFPRDLDHFKDQVHLKDPGREALANFMADFILKNFPDIPEASTSPGR